MSFVKNLLLLVFFLSTSLYAQELHYHKNMWCLKPDGTPNGNIHKENGYISMFDESDASGGTDRYVNQSLKEAFTQEAIEYGIPQTIPLKNITYRSEKISGSVTIEPISQNQIYIGTYQDGGEMAVLLTYYPDRKQTRKTFCYSVP